MGPTYIAHVVPGLEEFAAADLCRHLDAAEILRVLARFDERTSLLIFRYGGPPRALLSLRSTEDVFALVAERDAVPPGRSGLAAIRTALLTAPAWEAAAGAAFQLRPRRSRRVTFRVIARISGRHSYRRVDMQRAVERAVQERFPTWRLVEDNAQLELWVHLVGGRLICGLRLSDISMRQRDGRRLSLPASLKPTIAYAMVTLSEPRAGDVFLDPMCGSGTILIERAEIARYRLLLAGDLSEEAVEATRSNVGPRYKPIEIRQWDARRLPLEDASVSALVSNLPWGKQIGSQEENRALYPQLLAEWARVLQPEGRMVLLSSEQRLLTQAVPGQPLVLQRQIPVLVRGEAARIYSLSRLA